MWSTTRLRVSVATLALALAAGSASAEAAIVDRAPVGIAGERATKGFSSALSIVIGAPGGYERGIEYTGRAGDWLGPAYRDSANPASRNRTSVEWEVTFVRGGSLKAAARRGGDAGFPELTAKARKVAHGVGARRLGRLAAFTAIDAERSPGARTQAVIAIDLGRRLRAVVLFHLGSPAVDRTGAGGNVTVKGQTASKWNRAQAKAILGRVSVAGNLPVAKVRAATAGRRVSGRVSDVVGHAVGDIALTLEARRAGRWKTVAESRTDLRGGFAITAPKAGTYRVVATDSGGSKASRRLAVR
jgi:hypothetical protein